MALAHTLLRLAGVTTTSTTPMIKSITPSSIKTIKTIKVTILPHADAEAHVLVGSHGSQGSQRITGIHGSRSLVNHHQKMGTLASF